MNTMSSNSYYDIKQVQNLINLRTRRVLNWASTFDLMQKHYLYLSIRTHIH